MYICSYMLTFLFFKILFRFQKYFFFFLTLFSYFFSHSSTHQAAVWRGGSWLHQSDMDSGIHVHSERHLSFCHSLPPHSYGRRRQGGECWWSHKHLPAAKYVQWRHLWCLLELLGLFCVLAFKLYFSFRPVAQHGVPHQRRECVRGTRKPTSHRNPENEYVWPLDSEIWITKTMVLDVQLTEVNFWQDRNAHY